MLSTFMCVTYDNPLLPKRLFSVISEVAGFSLHCFSRKGFFLFNYFKGSIGIMLLGSSFFFSPAGV